MNLKCSRCWIPALILILLSSNLSAATRKQRTYEAYVTGNASQWSDVITEMEKSQENRTTAWKLELAEYCYGLAGYYIGIKKNDQAEPYVLKLDALASEILRSEPGNATAMSYKGAATAFRINLNSLKALILGKECLNWLDKAYKTGPENVQALADKGNALLRAPSMFGGDPKQSVLLFKKAVSLLEKRGQTTGNWFYFNLLFTTARAYNRIGEIDQAKVYMDKALQLEPRLKTLLARRTIRTSEKN